MDKVKKKNLILTNASATVIFAAGIIGNFLIFWNKIFSEGFVGAQGFLNVEIVIPISAIVTSALFVAIMYVFSIFGWMLKNKIMVWLPLGYMILLVVLFILFALLGNITNVTVFKYVTYSIFAVFSPLYAFMWFLGAWSILILVLLLILSIVAVIKVYQKKKK